MYVLRELCPGVPQRHGEIEEDFCSSYIMKLSDRMKNYEDAFRNYLPPRMPSILRIDGRAFHTLLKGASKPFDYQFAEVMDVIGLALMKEISTARFGYLQSDEISFLLIDYNRFDSQQWFGGNVQKMASVSASMAGSRFTRWRNSSTLVSFDSRVFAIPERDVTNYFIWRQRDWERNSLFMLARQHYSHAELLNRGGSEVHEMLARKDINWNDLEPKWKRGRVVTKDGIEDNLPIFSQTQQFISAFMEIEEE